MGARGRVSKSMDVLPHNQGRLQHCGRKRRQRVLKLLVASVFLRETERKAIN